MMTGAMNFLKKAVSVMTSMAVTAVTAASFVGFNTHGADVCEDQLRSMANEIAILVNEARAENGLEPVYVVPYLCEFAEVRAEETIQQFSHTRMNGRSFSSLIDTSIVDYSAIAENIAAGSDNAADTFEQWKNSPGHWANIMKPTMTHIGIGVVYDPESDYEWYWQQTFIRTDMEFADQYLPTEYEVAPKADGDLNGDGIVNSFDYILLSNYICKKNSNSAVFLNPAQIAAADCFHDGMITESDAKVMVRYLLGEYKSLPFEF